jgi:hypothetical protein
VSTRRRKYPGWLQWFIKLIIIVAALLVITRRLESESYQGIFSYPWHQPGLLIPAFLTLWLVNLLLDARIWQRAHYLLDRISISKAIETNLVCYTLSFITPVNSGELAGRYIMLEPSLDRRKTVFLTFWSHFPRLIVKILLGTMVLVILLEGAVFGIFSEVSILAIVGTLTLVSYFSFIRIQDWLSKMGWRKITFGDYVISHRPKFREKLGLLVLSGLKFLTYNFQFLILLMLWGGVSPDAEILTSVVGMYVLGALIPTLPAVDFIVKAGVAVVIFDNAIISESILLNATLVTWFFNLALPALAGGIIILKTDLLQAIRKQPLSGSPYDPLH